MKMMLHHDVRTLTEKTGYGNWVVLSTSIHLHDQALGQNLNFII